jgi:hypothetical protein
LVNFGAVDDEVPRSKTKTPMAPHKIVAASTTKTLFFMLIVVVLQHTPINNWTPGFIRLPKPSYNCNQILLSVWSCRGGAAVHEPAAPISTRPYIYSYTDVHKKMMRTERDLVRLVPIPN